VSKPVISVRAEDHPSWAEVVRHIERGESVSVIAQGDHVADVVPSGELERLRETIDVLSDADLVHDLREGLADVLSGRVFSAGDITADLDARRAASEMTTDQRGTRKTVPASELNGQPPPLQHQR